SRGGAVQLWRGAQFASVRRDCRLPCTGRLLVWRRASLPRYPEPVGRPARSARQGVRRRVFGPRHGRADGAGDPRTPPRPRAARDGVCRDRHGLHPVAADAAGPTAKAPGGALMGNLLLVALGGAAGSVTRYAVGVGALRVFGPALPVGTLIVNLAGCLLMG